MTISDLQGHSPIASLFECDVGIVFQQLTGFTIFADNALCTVFRRQLSYLLEFNYTSTTYSRPMNQTSKAPYDGLIRQLNKISKKSQSTA